MTTIPAFLALERSFTKTYQQYVHLPPAQREVHCLRELYPALFSPIRPDDLLAGRIDSYPLVGFGLELASGGPGYYCHEETILSLMADAGLTPGEEQQIGEMITFWQQEATIAGKLIPRLPDPVLKATTNAIAEMGGRLSGAVIDFDRLARLGLPGLRKEVLERQESAVAEGRDAGIYGPMLAALDLLETCLLFYAAQARQQAVQSADERREIELLEIARALESVTHRSPTSLLEAAQLTWLYALISGVVNYGRMDVYLGDFLARDLETGQLTETSALRLLQSLWQLMADRKIIFNGRVFVGGAGRRNPDNADRFAMLAMEATRTVIEVEPQLTLRWYEGMNPALWDKALDVIGEGRTFPMLYNDDVNIPAVMHGFNVDRSTAEGYLPYGCGEYAIDHQSFGSPNCGFNLLKALEVTLHQGRDVLTGDMIGLYGGTLDDFVTFDDLWAAYQHQIEYHVIALADRQRVEYQAEAESAAFLFISMLYDDCIARGKSLVNGGVRYQGGIIETFGLVNTGDALAVIKRLVYDQRRVSLADLVTAMDANYMGYDRIERLVQAAPRFGNDVDEVDDMVSQVSRHIASCARQQAGRIGFHYFMVVNINNYANVTLGQATAASADGRQRGAPLANGNTPTAGNDRSGVTALLNSMVKIDPSEHAGYTQNLKFSSSMFRDQRAKVSALLKAYFLMGGTQTMITVVGRGDLEAALQHPEQYRSLIVRVGGFSARFVELSHAIQLDLIQRTLY